MINKHGNAATRLFTLAACLIIFFAALPAPYSKAATAFNETLQLEASRPVSGWVNAAMARQAALAALRRQAAEQLAAQLESLPEIAALLPPALPATPETAAAQTSPTSQPEQVQTPSRAQMLNLLARFLLEEDKTPRESQSQGRLTLRQNFRIGGGDGIDGLRHQLAQLLGSPALQENYNLALQLEGDFLQRYDAAVEKLLNLPGQAAKTNGQPRASGQNKDEESGAAWESGTAWEAAAALHSALRATALYLDLLPALYGQNSLRPDLLEPLEEINRLLPENYLFLSELGRFYLWQERSGKAGQALDAALRLNPAFDQAYGHRGALWLLMHKPSLALADFNRAVSLARHKPESLATYHHGRAVVWKALGNNQAMCEDLRQSCLLGQCAAYEWAVAGRECPR